MSDQPDYFELEHALFDLEAELRKLSLWSNSAPSEQALASTLPFCVDQLSFHQWLQFVFIPRCYKLIAEKASLSMQASILPMAEESYPQRDDIKGLFEIIKQIDQILA